MYIGTLNIFGYIYISIYIYIYYTHEACHILVCTNMRSRIDSIIVYIYYVYI